MAKISSSNGWEAHFEKTSCELSLVATYKLSAPSNLYEPPIANTMAKMGTTMNDDVLMIDYDDAPPATTFAPMKTG